MAGRSIRTFTVLPHLPERLQALHKLAYNMWWCWNQDAVALFRRVDADLRAVQEPLDERQERHELAVRALAEVLGVALELLDDLAPRVVALDRS